MSTLSTGADGATASVDASPTSRQKVGLVLCGLYSLVNIPSAVTPTPEGSGDGPPLGILVLGTICGIVGLAATVMAWRGSRVGYRVAAGAIILATLTAVPAFFVDVPMFVKALVGVTVLITVAAVVLMFSARRPAPVVD